MTSSSKDIVAIRGNFLHFIANPFVEGEDACYEYVEDGLLFIEEGYIKHKGPYSKLHPKLKPETTVIDYSGKLILPGFIDTHLHYPQTDIIASYGKQLLEWLETYTFPREGMFTDPEYTTSVVDFFLEELLRNGTTSAQVMPTIHSQSADIFFQKCQEKNLRMISGKVLMDRNAPDFLLDPAGGGIEESQALIEKWHQKDRLLYAVTPRFAITSTDEQLKRSAELLGQYPELYLHTHLSENKDEIAFVAELFPWSKNYLDVYDHFGLVTDKATFAHSIHLDQETYDKLSDKKAAVSFCPTSNLFIGSGLFDLDATTEARIKIGIGTDVGGGTSFSMLKTLGEAYKVLQLRGQKLSPLKAFYLATLGGAESLCLENKIGNFEPGKEADFIVINSDATPLIERRMQGAQSLQEKLFILMTLGDDRCIDATYAMGTKLYEQ